MSYLYDGNVVDDHQRHQHHRQRDHVESALVALAGGVSASPSTGVGAAVPSRSPLRFDGGGGGIAGLADGAVAAPAAYVGDSYYDGGDDEAGAGDRPMGDVVDDEPSPKRRKRSRSQRDGGGSGSSTTGKTKRNYPANRQRKKTPATEEAYRTRDAALSELQRARADLEDARRRVASAEERIRIYEREVAEAEEAIVDAELSDPSNRKWNDMYRRLVEFRDENGHCNVHCREGGDLGRFVAQMRNMHKKPVDAHKKSLHRKPYRVRALERIGFAFDRREEIWMESYRRLVAYREEHGNMDVPHSHDLTLYNWVRSQTEQYRLFRNGDGDAHMDERRAALLDEVGIVEFIEGRKVAEADSKARAEAAGKRPKILSATDARWEKHFNELVAFKEEHGHVDVRENAPLRKWVVDQRKLVRAFRDGRDTKGYKMTDDRARRLEELVGEEIVLQREFRWKQRYKELVAYRDEHGDCLVPLNYKKNKQLAKWIGAIRTTYRRQLKEKENSQKGKAGPYVLTAERLRLLNDVGFVWDPVQKRKEKREEARKSDVEESGGEASRENKNDEKWMQRYRELKAHREANGGCCFVAHHENRPLYSWCRRHKLEYRKLQEGKGSTSLSQKRVELLKEIGFFERLCDQQKDDRKRNADAEKSVAKEEKACDQQKDDSKRNTDAEKSEEEEGKKHNQEGDDSKRNTDAEKSEAEKHSQEEDDSKRNTDAEKSVAGEEKAIYI